MDPEMMANLAVGEGKKRLTWLGRPGSIFSSLHDRRKQNKEPEKTDVRRLTRPPATTTRLITPPTISKQTATEPAESAPLLPKEELVTFFSTYVQSSCVELLGVVLYVWVSSLVAQTQTSCLTNGVVNGLLITALGYSFGKVSGGHFNPVVSLSVMASGGLSVPLALSFVGCHFIGSLLGALLTLAVMSFKVSSSASGETLTAYDAFGGGVLGLGDGVQWWQGVLCEAVLTFLWVTTALMTTVNRRTTTDLSALAVGAAVAVGVTAGSKVSGGSMNPARSLGPTVVMTLFDRGVWRGHGVYLVGPVLGGLLATAVYRLLLSDVERRLICLPVLAPPEKPHPSKPPPSKQPPSKQPATGLSYGRPLPPGRIPPPRYLPDR